MSDLPFSPAEAFSVKDQVVIVTGTAGYIGFGIAEAFAAAGASVVMSDRDGDHFRASETKLAAYKDRLLAVPADLTSESDLRQLVSATVMRFGRVNSLINCGGIPNSSRLELEDAESFDRMYQTNVRSLWLLTKLAIEHMPAGGGSIVNIASINAYRPFFYCSLYTGSKAAVIATTRELGVELAPRMIRVNSISPGTIPNFPRNWAYLLSLLNEPYRSEVDAKFPDVREGNVPAGAQPLPLHGRPWDIAMACIYLCSPAARFVSGADLVVDGAKLAEIPDVEPRLQNRRKMGWGLVRQYLRELPEEAWKEKPRWLRAELVAKANETATST